MSNTTPNTALSKNDNSGKSADVKHDDAGKAAVKDETAQPAAAPETKQA